MSDLIARLLGPDPDDCPACRTDATVAIACGRGECVALRKLRAEAAAALAAKDAEIERLAALGLQAFKQSERDVAEIAALRAGLATAEAALREALEATGRHPLSVGFAHAPATRQELADRLSEIGAILEAAHDAAKGASDAT